MPDSNSLKLSHICAFLLFLVYSAWINSLNMLSHVDRGGKVNRSSSLISLIKSEIWIILQERGREE